MLKTSSTKLAKPKKGRVGVGDSSKTERDGSEPDNGEVDDGKVEGDKVGKKVQKMSKSKKSSKFKETLGSDFPILGIKLVFTKLR